MGRQTTPPRRGAEGRFAGQLACGTNFGRTTADVQPVGYRDGMNPYLRAPLRL